MEPSPTPPASTVQTVHVGALALEIHTPPDFDALLNDAAQRAPDDVDRIPYYATLWPSALGLADVLWERRDALKGRRVLELGCGLSLPSIVAAKSGAQVTATDFHPDAAAWCLRNAHANGVPVAYQPCDWSQPPAWEPFDLVIGSDLLYERRHIPALVACVSRLCAAHGTALLADPGRDGLASLTAAMQADGWDCELLPRGEIYVLVFGRGSSAAAPENECGSAAG